jgi:MFS family permease
MIRRLGAWSSLGALPAQLTAAKVLLSSPALLGCQLSLALAISVEMAHLVAVSTYLYIAHGTSSVVAFGVAGTVVPALCVPALAASAPQLGHGRLLQLLTGAACVATAGTAIAMQAGWPALPVIGLGVVAGTCVKAVRPVTSAARPGLVRTPEELVGCSAAAGFVDGGATLFGPALAALLLAVAGAPATMGATVVLLAAAALASGRIPAVPAMQAPAARRRVGTAVRVIARTPAVRLVALLGVGQTTVRGALNTVLPVFVIGVLALDDGAVGLLLAAIGVGGMVGLPVALALVGRTRLFRSYGVGLGLWGIPLALAAPVPHLGIALVLFAVIGVANTVVDVAVFSALPRAVPPRDLAAVFGIQETLWQIGMAVGAVLGGVLLLTGLGARGALVLVGLALPVAAVAAARHLGRFDKRLIRHDVDVELLRGQPLFRTLPVPTLDGLAQQLGHARFGAGEVILEEGTPGDRYLLVTSGVVAISRRSVPLDELGPGAGLGEIALVRDVPRTATAVARTTVTARTIGRTAFLTALGQDPGVRAAAEAVAEERLARTPRG